MNETITISAGEFVGACFFIPCVGSARCGARRHTDIGVGIHAPYQTFHYDKSGKTDYTRPINTYFNIPSALDAIRFNFGIGYPF